MKITRLPIEVANKIAAGEVVERPASVVKELAENAVDAGARNIDIDVTGGGLELIRVVDDGCGMDREDASLAFERHATSKIRTAEELFCVNTLGFRGEALPSVASVSRLTLITKDEQSETAWKVELEGGALISEGPSPGRQGTTVEVESLFFNTPARLKYLKSRQAESNRILAVAEKLALANPSVSIRLAIDGRPMLSSSGDGSQRGAARSVFGATADRMSGGEASSPGIEAYALVGAPEDFRRRRQDQHVIVNGRPVASQLVYAAIDRGLEGVKSENRFPPCVIWLEVDPSRVDVNVHPAKAEVRFADEAGVFSAVNGAVKGAMGLSSANLSIEAAVPEGPAQPGGYRKATAPGRLIAEKYSGYLGEGGAGHGPRGEGFSHLKEVRAGYGGHLEGSGTSGDAKAGTLQLEEAGPSVIGQFQGSYIVAELSGKLIVIDQHVAHERILVDRFLARLSERRVDSQALLVPETVELMPAEAATAREEADALRQLGFDFEMFGARSAIVRAVPVVGGTEPSPEELLSAALRDLAEGRRDGTDVDGRLRRAAVEMACKGAVKAGEKLDPVQMRELVLDLFATSDPYRCPHGRPILLTVDLSGIERGVGRR